MSTTNDKTGISNTLSLGAGCYWGTEKFIVKDFQKLFKGSIESAKVGFMNPHFKKTSKPPTYKEVCSGSTGFVEVLNVTLSDPTPELLTELFKFFFRFHDPTTKNKQGNDSGTQYASAIFYGDETQKEIALAVRDELQLAVTQGKVPNYSKKSVETGILAATEFFPAHEEHQEYLAKNPSGYCNHYYRIKEWPSVKKDSGDDIGEEKEKKGGIISSFKKMIVKS